MTPQKIASLFSRSVAVGIAQRPLEAMQLWQEEIALIASAVPIRQHEFLAGRDAARLALAYLGFDPAPILINPDRTPIWPLGIVGSISHCENFCAAVVAKDTDVSSIGFDVEGAAHLPQEIKEMIYGDKEAAFFLSLPAPTGASWEKLTFSAKEAFYKCYYPITRTFLDFRDVLISFSVEEKGVRGSFFVSIEDKVKSALLEKHVCRARWLVSDGFIFTGVTFEKI